MKIHYYFLYFLFLLTGCAPSYSVWSGGLDLMVGTPFESHIYDDCTNGCGDSYWSPVNNNEVYDKIVDESGGRRYYITWYSDCKYSIFVSGDGIIRSWCYEAEDKSACYVF